MASQRMKVESSPPMPEDVVKVTVGDEDAVEAFKADARLQDLALRALSAVD